MFLHMSLDRQVQNGNRFEESCSPLIQPTCSIGIATRFPGRDDHRSLKTNPDERMGMPKSNPEHGALIMELQYFSNAPGMADGAICAEILMTLIHRMIGSG